MVKMDYLEALQGEVCVFVIVALGYLCGGIKMFTLQEALAMKRTIFLIAVPGLVFREIAIHKLTLENWQPFFNGILVQVTIHIIYMLIALIGRFQSKIHAFLSMLYSTSYLNFIFFGYPIIQVLFGDDYVFISAMQSLVTHILCIPVHTFLGFDKIKFSDSDSISQDDEINEMAVDRSNGLPIHPVDHHAEHNDQSNDEDTSVEEITTNENKDEEETNHENEKDILISEQTEIRHNENDQEDSSSDNTKPKFKDKHPKVWAVLWSVVTPVNVCAILGIIWSATGLNMPVFLNDFAFDLEKATLASGLFTCGVIMWNHPFFGCNLVKILLALFMHYVIIPLISLFWSKICKLDSTTATINVIMHSMPSALIAFGVTPFGGLVMKTASFSFFWSILLFLPMFTLWVIALNEIHIF